VSREREGKGKKRGRGKRWGEREGERKRERKRVYIESGTELRMTEP
jgi:hypothetical protein